MHFDTWTQQELQIADPIRRIWAGERDAETLTFKLNYQSRAIVLAILHRLGVDVPPLIAELDDYLANYGQIKIQQVLDENQSFIAAVVAVAYGNEEILLEVEHAVDEATQFGLLIADPIRRIWAGERDATQLTATLNPVESAIIEAILAQLDGSGALG
jgi:hypothetical protein